MDLGRTIRNRRYLRGWSLDEFAKETGVSKGRLSDVENGDDNITIATLDSIAQAFGTRAGDLLCEAGYTQSSNNAARLARELRGALWLLKSLEADAHNWELDAMQRIRTIEGALADEEIEDESQADATP